MLRVNNNVIGLVLQALREKGMNKTELARQMGLGKSWVTRFLQGDIQTLKDEHVDGLERILGIRFVVFEEQHVPEAAVQITAAMERSGELREIVMNALKLHESRSPQTPLTPGYIPTKDMPRLGNRIITLCYANEDKPGKVAREVLTLLATWKPSSDRKERTKIDAPPAPTD